MTAFPDARRVAAVAILSDRGGLGPASHRPARAARARLLADACDAVAGAVPELSPEGAVWSADGVRVAIARAGSGDGRLLVALTATGPALDDPRGALIRVLAATDSHLGDMVHDRTLAVTAALLRAGAGALDGSGPSLSQDEWDDASRAICAEVVSRDARKTGDLSSGVLNGLASLLPSNGLLHDHKPLGPLTPHSLHWHSPGSIHPVEPPSCPAVAEVSVDRQGRLRLSFVWRPDWSEGDEDPVATLRAVARMREAETASLDTRPEDRA